MPSHSPEGELSGLSESRALALCRRLVAVHCLYGVDKNPLAVELAKLALWIEAHCEGLPLTFLDHRLVLGDSLTGPFWDKLAWYPGRQRPVDDIFRQGIDTKLADRLSGALADVKHLESNVGASLAEIIDKREIKADFDRQILPFRILAAAWSGGVMLGDNGCDDDAYAELLHRVGTEGELPEQIDTPRLRAMIAKGLGLPDGENLPAQRDDFVARALSADAIPALPYDLAFPEVFHPNGVVYEKRGFDVVLGNPPWDAIQFKSKEFFASFDFEIMNAPTKRERTAIEERLTADPAVEELFERYRESFEEQKRVIDALYEYQKVFIEGDLCGRQLDSFRVFMERNAQVAGPQGYTGVVVPSAFHANEGATGVRRLYLEKMALDCCYSFENRRKLFEIDSRFKFALVVAQRGQETREFPCAFYLHDDEWLFGDRLGRPALTYVLDFVQKTGGEYLGFVELRTQADVEVIQVCFQRTEPFDSVCGRAHIRLMAECHMRNDAWRFVPALNVVRNARDPRDPDVTDDLLSRGYLALQEGKTFHQFNDHWGEPARYVVPLANLSDKAGWLRAACYFRLAYRNISASTNERTSIFNLHPPGVATGEKGPAERTPHRRPTAYALGLAGAANSFAFDFCLRCFVSSSTVNYFFLARAPLPKPMVKSRFVLHNAVRLTCNHAGYEPLWHEQLGKEWREDRPAFTWPALEGDDARWAVRAAIDAVVADAYGLDRDQYAHILSTFSHASYPKAPELCLAAYDELKTIGLGAFTKQHDPYWDIPLNEELPKPVIDLPIPNETEPTDAGFHRQKDGQATFLSPGPLFDDSGRVVEPGLRPARKHRRRRSAPKEKPEITESDYQNLLAYLRTKREITSADAQQLLNLPASAVRPLLKRLVEEGFAVKEGKAPSTRYITL